MKIIEKIMNRNGRTAGVLQQKAFSAPSFLTTELGAGYRETIARTSNSIVAAAVAWLWRQMSSVRYSIRKNDQTLTGHPAEQIVGEAWRDYAFAIIDSLVRDGNSYLLKYRNGTGQVQSLIYLPAKQVQPVRDRLDEIVSYYVQRGSTSALYPAEDIIHLRWQRDKDDPELGISPLHAVRDLIHADDQAVIASDAIMSNLGIIGVVVAPEDGVWEFDEESKRLLKREFEQSYTGRRRGSLAFFNQRVRLETVQVNMSQFNSDWLTSLTEERICAVLGINPIVLYLGSGLNQSTYNNVAQAREEAWEGLVIPLLTNIAHQIDREMLQSYDPDLRWVWDWSQTPAMIEQSNRQLDALDKAFQRGVVTVAEYRTKLGLPATEADEVYLRSPNLIEVLPGAPMWEQTDED